MFDSNDHAYNVGVLLNTNNHTMIHTTWVVCLMPKIMRSTWWFVNIDILKLHVTSRYQFVIWRYKVITKGLPKVSSITLFCCDAVSILSEKTFY